MAILVLYRNTFSFESTNKGPLRRGSFFIDISCIDIATICALYYNYLEHSYIYVIIFTKGYYSIKQRSSSWET